MLSWRTRATLPTKPQLLEPQLANPATVQEEITHRRQYAKVQYDKTVHQPRKSYLSMGAKV